MGNKIESLSAKENRLKFNDSFSNRMISKQALTDAELQDGEFPDYTKLKNDAREAMEALGPNDNLQLMLASQMVSIHTLQQKMMIYANNTKYPDISMKYVNNITKLSNVFIQQANLMKKLKGEVEKKIVIEHVHVHSGAQAVVGTVHASTQGQEE